MKWVLTAASVAALLTPYIVSAQQEPALGDFAFLTGCWVGSMGPLEVREYWTEPEAGVMMWTTRFFRGGELIDWEFGLLHQVEGTPTLKPYPRGVESPSTFPLARWETEYVFENLEHDFPVRIIYPLTGDDGLAPRIEGRDGNGPSWSLQRATCPGG